MNRFKHTSITQAFCLLVFLFLVNGCCQLNALEHQTPALTYNKRPEPIYAFEIEQDNIRFIVKSNGCTKAQHFSLLVNTPQPDVAKITLVRNKQDLCRAAPRRFPVKLRLDSASSQKQIKIDNPIDVTSRYNNAKSSKARSLLNFEFSL